MMVIEGLETSLARAANEGKQTRRGEAEEGRERERLITRKTRKSCGR